MLAISLSRSSVLKGEPIALRFTVRPQAKYGQVQVEVFTAGVANPSSALGFDTVPQHPSKDDIQVAIVTQNLRVGVYEV
jgi:hypothetical protein